MAIRLSDSIWKNIFRNCKEMGEEVIVMWLDSDNAHSEEYVLTNSDDANPELFENGFKTESEAQYRLDELQKRLL